MILFSVNFAVLVIYFVAKPIDHKFIDVAAAYLLRCKIRGCD